MHDKLFANQQNLNRQDLEIYAQEIGLDLARFNQDLDSRAYKTRVDQDLVVADQIGTKGTPNFFINGRIVCGAQPFEAFKAIIDEELSNAQKLLAQGTPSEKLYDVLMASAKPNAAEPAIVAQRNLQREQAR